MAMLGCVQPWPTAKAPLRNERAAALFAEKPVGRDLERNVALQLLVMSAKDHAHAASADLFDQPIVPMSSPITGSGLPLTRILGPR